MSRPLDDRRPQDCDPPRFTIRRMWSHASGTMMLKELSHLMDAVPEDVGFQDYRTAALECNMLLKGNTAKRFKSFKPLRKLFDLDEPGSDIDIDDAVALAESWRSGASWWGRR